MASVKGVNFTKRTAEPVEKVIASQSHGRLRVQYDSYEASSLASGSDISVAKLPAGAIVYDIVVHFDALGSATIAVGDSADADRYITATSVSSAGQMSMSQEGAIDGCWHPGFVRYGCCIIQYGLILITNLKGAIYIELLSPL